MMFIRYDYLYENFKIVPVGISYKDGLRRNFRPFTFIPDTDISISQPAIYDQQAVYLYMILPLLHVTLYFGEMLDYIGVEGYATVDNSHLHCRDVLV